MGWKHRGRLAGLLLLSLSFVAANAGYSIGPARAGADDPSPKKETLDQRMIAAQAAARGQFDQFLNIVLDDTGPAPPDAGVKVAVPDGDGAHRLVWLSLVAIRNGQFVGRPTDASRTLEKHRFVEAIEFRKDQVRDWYLIGPNEEIFGAYSTRAVLGDLPAETAARIGLPLAETAVPANW